MQGPLTGKIKGMLDKRTRSQPLALVAGVKHINYRYTELGIVAASSREELPDTQ